MSGFEGKHSRIGKRSCKDPCASDDIRLCEGNLVGESPEFLEACHRIRRIAGTDATVLIEGETGTGKELAARAIHYLGARRELPFIPVNCGAVPDNLVENEFFGHARGAYTDARDAARGLVADADNGTLFLDEIEALSQRAQVVLLRFLQDSVYRPLGGRQAVQADVRVIAASNVDLRHEVWEGRFRQDLIYRLRIMTVEMPPLRERPGDVPILVDHFLRKLAKQYPSMEKCLQPDLMRALCEHHWPGNVRELENLLHRAFLNSDSPEIGLGDTDLQAARERRTGPRVDALNIEGFLSGFKIAKARAIEQFERAYVTWAIKRSRGNVSAAARSSGKERRAFGKLVKKYGIAKTGESGGVERQPGVSANH